MAIQQRLILLVEGHAGMSDRHPIGIKAIASFPGVPAGFILIGGVARHRSVQSTGAKETAVSEGRRNPATGYVIARYPCGLDKPVLPRAVPMESPSVQKCIDG